MTYLITFCTYGSRVVGEPGAVNREHHLVGGPWFPENARLAATTRNGSNHEPYVLDATRRQIVLDAILEVCRHRGWAALAVHVRTTHLHIVVDANTTPERAMNTFKSYASRALNASHIEPGTDTLGPPWQHAILVDKTGNRQRNLLRFGEARCTHGTARRVAGL